MSVKNGLLEVCFGDLQENVIALPRPTPSVLKPITLIYNNNLLYISAFTEKSTVTARVRIFRIYVLD